MKRILLIVLGISLSFLSLYSQEKQSPLVFSLELSSKYMWRGIEYGTAPVVFPMLSCNYKAYTLWELMRLTALIRRWIWG